MKNFLFLFFLGLSLSACHDGSGFNALAEGPSYDSGMAWENETTEQSDEATPSSTSKESDGRQANNTAPQDRKIIKTAEIRGEVKDLKKSSASVESKIKKYQGFIGNVNHQNGYSQMEANFSIRVPHDQFDALLNDLGEEALYLEYKNIRVQDVTEEFLDLETRLNTKKLVRDRYIEVLKNKAKTVEEILMSEDKIRVIQEEIESKEGRLNYLKNQVSLSTIHLNLYQNINGPIAQQPSFFHKLGRAFGEGWETFLNLVIGLVYLWPIVLILAFLFYLFRRFWWAKKS